jgi:hypothetical protein
MGIVPLGHPCVGVTEVRRDDRQRRSRLQQMGGVGVTYDMEAGWRVDPGASAGFAQRPVLMRPPP